MGTTEWLEISDEQALIMKKWLTLVMSQDNNLSNREILSKKKIKSDLRKEIEGMHLSQCPHKFQIAPLKVDEFFQNVFSIYYLHLQQTHMEFTELSYEFGKRIYKQ